MAELKYWQAINEALHEELERDESVVMLGEDIARPGGPFGATRGLLERFGPDRVRDTPISEGAVMGIATGAALQGCRPIVEVMFMDFLLLGLDQLVNHAAKLRFMSGGAYDVPLTVVTACGARTGAGPQHSQSFEAFLAHVPGIEVLWPSEVADVKALLKAAIRSDRPAVVVVSLALWRKKGDVPQEESVGRIGEAAVRAVGTDLTIVAYGPAVDVALEAGARLRAEAAISCEVIDLRSLSPLDLTCIVQSVEKTRRLIVLQDGYPLCGIAEALLGRLHARLHGVLETPARVLAPVAAPVPFSPSLERLYFPGVDELVRNAEEVLHG